jgi:adenylate kinase
MASTVALLGPPGCGKGTQAARLRDELGFVALATGDLLREARAAGSDLGRRASEYMDRGELAPDGLIVAMIRQEIASSDDKPVVLDGFPRTVAQADALAGALCARARELSAVVLVDVPDDVVVERISGRFFRRFTLPDTADADNISATGRNGVLEISIPKHPKVQPRRISVDL